MMFQGKESIHCLINHLSQGFAYHQIIKDGQGNPLDYVFLAVNQAFESITSYKKEKVIGRRVTEIIPHIKEWNFDWIRICGKVALTGEEISFQEHFPGINQCLEVAIFSDKPGYFSVLFAPSSRSILPLLKGLEELNLGDFDYQGIAHYLRGSLKAQAVLFHLYEKNRIAKRVALSYVSEAVLNGLPLVERELSFVEKEEDHIRENPFITFRVKDLGEVYMVRLWDGKNLLGNFTVVMSRQGQIDLDTLEILALKLGLLISKRRIEEFVKENELRWQFALEGVGDGFWEWNLATNRVYYSNQWKKMLGFSPEEIQDTFEEWQRRIYPHDYDETIHSLQSHLRGEIPFYQSEHRLFCKDGVNRWFFVRGQVIQWDYEGKPLKVMGLLTLIHSKKKNEERLKNLHQLSMALSSISSLKETLDICLQNAIAYTQLDAGGIYLINERDGSFSLKAHQGLSQAFIESAAWYSRKSPQVQMIQKKVPIYFDYEKDELSTDEICIKEGQRTIAIIPILYQGDVLASLNLASFHFSSISLWDQITLETIAASIGSFIARSITQNQLEEREIKYRKVFESSQDAIMGTLLIVTTEPWRCLA